jgi:putative tRNA adenosine deaminase-associated protein
VPYFTAALARTGSRWVARDLEVDPDVDLRSLADRMRAVAYDDEPVLLILEHEDEWFALVRVDAEDDPRVFLSDVPVIARSPYAELLGAEEVEPEPEGDDDGDGEEPAAQPAGDADVLADVGVPPGSLKSLCEEGLPPAETLAEIATRAGFEDLLDGLR